MVRMWEQCHAYTTSTLTVLINGYCLEAEHALFANLILREITIRLGPLKNKLVDHSEKKETLNCDTKSRIL